MIDNEDQNPSDAIDSEESESPQLDQKTTDDNPESASLQGEEAIASRSEPTETASPDEDDNKDDGRVHDNDENLAIDEPADLRDVLSELAQFSHATEDYLRWKEELKLLTMDAVLNLPYYELWRAEANDWFRRSVILRSRRRKLEKKKGA
ncbi:hypothetical protein [Pseudobacteriovorax antillogorgiicola]|uniref:Uncharacterized protein n=1 Tax=Pseudobacteriovorax antillogorgiicola TaxID=1513793 RepID=A0A1Y6C691_9BACT|nr:hypothetical protein [Pseudobacteriovorax antillogorgiicola]TCS49469.1 hypothetical protein EDD56_115151 [Pseudobacteriovorax antillogorgiicola]SMF46267.1 hypothetical protein SAMN06296036_11434 [Pseudobacteriovorax antillogorgiicola]